MAVSINSFIIQYSNLLSKILYPPSTPAPRSNPLQKKITIPTVCTFGSVPLKTYLPDGNIDLTAFSHDLNLKDSWANQVRDMLSNKEKNENAELNVKEVQYIQAKVKIIKYLVENIVVDVSLNQVGGLCTLCFLDEVQDTKVVYKVMLKVALEITNSRYATKLLINPEMTELDDLRASLGSASYTQLSNHLSHAPSGSTKDVQAESAPKAFTLREILGLARNVQPHWPDATPMYKTEMIVEHDMNQATITVFGGETEQLVDEKSTKFDSKN